jgi:colicin import membrane protein
MDLVLAGRDNIDPAVLFNSETDFSEFDFSLQDPASANARTTPLEAKVETADHVEPSKKNSQTKKRSRNTDSSELMELLTNKWEKEMKERVAEREERQAIKKQKQEEREQQKEERQKEQKEREAKSEARAEQQERQNEMLLDCLKSVTSSLSQIADAAGA